jgi:hypothetical protein
VKSGDPLEWLLPEAGAREQAELRRVVQALRVLRADLLRPGTRSVEPSWFRARGELEDLTRLEAVRALESVLAAHLAALRPADSFLPVPPARLTLDEAWRRLLARRLCAPAPPGASLVRAALALVACGAGLGTPGFWAEYWRAAFAHVEQGPHPRRWERELVAVRAARVRPRVLARFVGGLAAAELERGAPARAFALLRAHAPLWRLDAGLARLAHWSALVLHAPTQRDPAPGEPLPLTLAELARDDPRWGACLAGPALGGAPRLYRALPGCSELGVRVRALWSRADGRVELLRLEGPGIPSARVELLRRHPAAALLALEKACAPLVERTPPGAHSVALQGAFLGAEARALAFVPFVSAGASLCWQLEWSHALTPCRAQLASLGPLGARAGSELVPCVPVPREDPRALALAPAQRLLAAVGVTRFVCFAPGTPARRLAGRGLEPRETDLARAGETLPAGHFVVELRAGERSLARVFGAGEASLATHASAALAPLTEGLFAASFRAVERSEGRADPWWDPAASAHARLATLAPRGPWLLVGPPSSGRHTLARALLYRAGFEPRDLGRILTGPLREPLAPGTVWIGAPSSAAPAGHLVHVPGLSEQRDELASILRHLTRAGGRIPLALRDDGLAQLWRQDWSGGWAQLLALLEGLAQSTAPIAAAEVRAALLASGVEPRLRRASVAGAELVSLLAATRHRSGSPNLTRAGRWLGWNARTLARRLGTRSARE